MCFDFVFCNLCIGSVDVVNGISNCMVYIVNSLYYFFVKIWWFFFFFFVILLNIFGWWIGIGILWCWRSRIFCNYICRVFYGKFYYRIFCNYKDIICRRFYWKFYYKIVMLMRFYMLLKVILVEGLFCFYCWFNIVFVFFLDWFWIGMVFV